MHFFVLNVYTLEILVIKLVFINKVSFSHQLGKKKACFFILSVLVASNQVHSEKWRSTTIVQVAHKKSNKDTENKLCI